MNKYIEELRHYHSRNSKLLDQLSDTVKRYQNSKDKNHKTRMFDIVRQIHDIDEPVHHANEEIIREELIQANVRLHPSIQMLQRDHEGFARIVHRLFDLEKSRLPAVQICEHIQNYITNYFDHMDCEENFFFPMAEKHLSDVQWTHVAQKWHVTATRQVSG